MPLMTYTAPAPADYLSAAPNTVKPRPQLRSLQSCVSFLCPLSPTSVSLTETQRTAVFSLSLTVHVPTLDLGIRPARVQNLLGGRTAISLPVSHYKELL